MTRCFRCWISCSFFGLLLSLASCSASMCVGRRSGYPFSGPRSRSQVLANGHLLINAVVGPPTLWQARIGPAPGHPNHLPGSGFGRNGTAKTLISVGGGVCGRRPENANHAARQREVVKRKWNRKFAEPTSADTAPTSPAVPETHHCLVGWTGPAPGCGGKTGSGPARRPRQKPLPRHFAPAAPPPV